MPNPPPSRCKVFSGCFFAAFWTDRVQVGDSIFFKKKVVPSPGSESNPGSPIVESNPHCIRQKHFWLKSHCRAACPFSSHLPLFFASSFWCHLRRARWTRWPPGCFSEPTSSALSHPFPFHLGRMLTPHPDDALCRGSPSRRGPTNPGGGVQPANTFFQPGCRPPHPSGSSGNKAFATVPRRFPTPKHQKFLTKGLKWGRKLMGKNRGKTLFFYVFGGWAMVQVARYRFFLNVLPFSPLMRFFGPLVLRVFH